MYFPECDFEHPLLAEELIGRYEIKVTYYDKNYNQVTSADEPGRYGAVVEVVPEGGRVIRRYRTLYRQANDFTGSDWWRYEANASIALPEAMGINPDVIAGESRTMSEHLKWRFLKSATICA